MFIKKPERILSIIMKDINIKFESQIKKLLELLDYEKIDRRIINILVENDMSHLCWRYQLVKKRYKHKSVKRQNILGILVDSKNEWGREASKFYYDVDYWVKRGYSEKEAELKILNTRKALSIPKTEEQKQRFKEIGEKNREIHSQKTKDYWLNLDKDLKEKRIENLKSNIILAAKKRTSSSFLFKPDYWIKKLGITKEEAKSIVSKNSERTLSFFMEKYGESIGNIKFNEMIEKRVETWKNKPEEEKNKHKENIRNNSHVGIYTENTISNIENLNFYLFYHVDGIKFGLTKREKLSQRWKSEFGYDELLFKEMRAIDALNLENKIKKEFECTYNEILGTTEFIKCQKNDPIIFKIINGEI